MFCKCPKINNINKYYTLYFCDCFQDDDLELTYFLLSPDDKVFFSVISQVIFSNWNAVMSVDYNTHDTRCRNWCHKSTSFSGANFSYHICIE